MVEATSEVDGDALALEGRPSSGECATGGGPLSLKGSLVQRRPDVHSDDGGESLRISQGVEIGSGVGHTEIPQGSRYGASDLDSLEQPLGEQEIQNSFAAVDVDRRATQVDQVVGRKEEVGRGRPDHRPEAMPGTAQEG